MRRLKDILSHEGLSDLLSTASYGSYWAVIKIKRSEYHLAEEWKNECIEDKWASVLLNGGTLSVYDEGESGSELYEDEPVQKHPLTLKAVRKGLRLMKEQYPDHWTDLVEENEDAVTGDVWLQLAVFGEVVYG